jgi:hypothetical protein
MARRKTGKSRIVENKWQCEECGLWNKGRHIQCQSCGAAKQKSERDVVNAGAKTVTDKGLLADAQQAPNFVCGFCLSQNRDDDGNCVQCGASRESSEERAHSDVADHSRPPTPSDGQGVFVESVLGRSVNQEWDVPLPEGYTPLPRRTHIPSRSATIAPTARRYRRLLSTLCIVFGAVVIVWLLIFLFSTHEGEATVSSLTWEYTSTLYQKGVHEDSDWRDEMSAGHYDESCTVKFFDYVDCNPTKCNPHEVPYRCNPRNCNCVEQPVDLGNGFSRMEQFCDTCYDTCTRTEYSTCYEQCPVNKDWCDYKYDTWPQVDQRQLGGDTHKVRWPSLFAQGSNQRLDKIEFYSVALQPSDGGSKVNVGVNTLQEFRSFNIGDVWIVKTNRAGMFDPQYRKGHGPK